MKPLVSIITPCYNGESFLRRFLDSLLVQDYPRIEFILVNDGSTDRTNEVVTQYRKRLQNNLERFVYIEQENQGQAAALNQGLAIFTGDYLTWPDSDDFFPCADAISQKVDWMESHHEIGLLCSRANIVDESDLNKTIGYLECLQVPQEQLFKHFLFAQNVCFAPGCFIVRASAFLKCVPLRKIRSYTGLGQNWQMLLPIVFSSQVGFMQDVLYTYVVRANSHSHSEQTYTQQIQMLRRYERLLNEILDNLDDGSDKCKELKSDLAFHYEQKRICASVQYKEKYVISTHLSSNQKKQLQKYEKIQKIKKTIKKIPFVTYLLRKAKGKGYGG